MLERGKGIDTVRVSRRQVERRPLAVLGATASSEIYRVKIPFKKLGLHWVPAELLPLVQSRWDSYNVIVLPRIAPLVDGMLEGIRVNQRQGKIFVYDADDAYTGEVLQQERLELAEALWMQCSAITTSTPYLKELMSLYNSDVRVLPNCVNLDDWTPSIDAREVEGLTIGLVGSRSHDSDWQIVLSSLLQIAEEYPEISFVVAGFMPSYFSVLPQDRVTFFEFAPYKQLPEIVRQIDIGLAPILDTQLNRGRSAIKVIEYMSSVRRYGEQLGGIPWVASDVGPYRTLKAPGLLARSPKDFYHCIKRLLDDAKLRELFGIDGLKWVRQHRDINTQAYRWTEVYNTISRRKT